MPDEKFLEKHDLLMIAMASLRLKSHDLRATKSLAITGFFL